MNHSLLHFDIDYSLLDLFENNHLYSYKMMPLFQKQLFIYVATSLENPPTQRIVEIFQQPVKFIQVPHQELQFEWKNLSLKKKLFHLGKKAIENQEKENHNSFILNFIDEILLFSILNNVSDIHFECFEKSVVLRCRIDGVLRQFFRFEIALYFVISSIIKYLGNLDLSQKRLPLSSRISRMVQDKSYDIRLSTLPTIHGESIVLRILDNGNINKNLNEIGFEPKTLAMIHQTLGLTQGLVLVTGPTGSGKTTTLYSMLSEVNTTEKKIITIEDPVEYKLDGVAQVNLNTEINLDYPMVLKNVLRQDPDILMIGEIRDAESLRIAIQASLTGHLVLATLHTNGAVETITRLLDLEAQPYLVSATLKMVISQRLLRVLCPFCKSASQEQEDIFEPVGCKECNFTGFKGRQVVTEAIQIDSLLSGLIGQYQSSGQIEQQLQTQGFHSLKHNGKQLVLQGKTSWSEFLSKIDVL